MIRSDVNRGRASVAAIVRATRVTTLLATSALALGAPDVGAGAAYAASTSAAPPPSSEARRLDRAMAQVSRNPRDIDTLLEAGNAASAAGDNDAAVGFFRRAEQVGPNDWRALSALASALLRANDPVGALPLFARAERGKSLGPAEIGDRGLAYDLIGDNGRAQRDYRQALALAENAEITRRLALSQAIAGDQRGAEATLRPLLEEQDKAGWRTRAFIFAISGQVDEAVTVAKTLLPGDLANSITPYLRFMPRLTHAQQAAAANLGVFPHASEIGRDDPRIAAYLATAGGPVLAGADKPLVPAGTPLGRRVAAVLGRGETDAPRARSRTERAEELAARTAPPEPPPARQITMDDGLAVNAQGTSVPASRAEGIPQLAAIARQASMRPRSPATPHAAALPTVPPVASSRGLAKAFGDIGTPDLPSAPRAGAVDITRLQPSQHVAVVGSGGSARAGKPVPSRAAERVAPSHPSRIWVQLGVGRDHAAMAADWRRMTRSAGAAFKGQQSFVSDDGARDRLLAGPFASEAAASAFVRLLGAAGITGPYIWISPAGQVVDPLATD